MAEDSRDVLMKLEMTPGKFVPAECLAVIDPNDKLATGFQGGPMTGATQRGNYFSIEDFTFDMGINGRNSADDAAVQDQNTIDQVADVAKQINKTADVLQQRARDAEQRARDLEQRVLDLEQHLRRGAGGAGDRPGRAAAMPVPSVKTAGGRNSTAFGRFMTEGRAFSRRDKKGYPSDLEPISITKRMDISSTTLFDCCKTSFKFNSASILKRKAIGATGLFGFMRVDLFDVMLIELNWDDDDVIKENFKFVCRKAVVQYSMETPSTDPSKGGTSVLTQLPSVEWSVLNTQ